MDGYGKAMYEDWDDKSGIRKVKEGIYNELYPFDY
jgi:hypothetical protein